MVDSLAVCGGARSWVWVVVVMWYGDVVWCCGGGVGVAAAACRLVMYFRWL